MRTWQKSLMACALVLAACARPVLSPRAARPGRTSYSVATYNVECDKHGDASVIEAVGTSGADVVCLQETTPKFEPVLKQRYASEYPYQLYRHNEPRTGPAGLAVLSRFPLIDRKHHRSPSRWHPAWHVDLETPSGTVQLLLVHLRAKLSGHDNDLAALLSIPGDHLREIRHFMRWTDPSKPTLVIGDFNEEEDGAAIRWLEQRGFRNALPLFRRNHHTWRYPVLGLELRQTLDHILFDRGFEPLDARVVDAGRSDHLPVVARLEVVSSDARWSRAR